MRRSGIGGSQECSPSFVFSLGWRSRRGSLDVRMVVKDGELQATVVEKGASSFSDGDPFCWELWSSASRNLLCAFGVCN